MATPPPPIPLPLQIHQPALIPRPPAPANPPTPADHVHAVNYVKRVEAASGDRLFMHLRKEYAHNVIAAVGGATDIQVQHAYRYLSHIDAALNLPASFQLPAVQVGLQAALQVALQAVLPAALQQALAELYIMGAQNHNRQVINGISTPFREVRFPDGSRPTQAPHHLPLLDSTLAINQLMPAQMVAYINRYTPGTVVPNQRPTRIRLIKLAIGCPLNR